MDQDRLTLPSLANPAPSATSAAPNEQQPQPPGVPIQHHTAIAQSQASHLPQSSRPLQNVSHVNERHSLLITSSAHGQFSVPPANFPPHPSPHLPPTRISAHHRLSVSNLAASPLPPVSHQLDMAMPAPVPHTTQSSRPLSMPSLQSSPSKPAPTTRHQSTSSTEAAISKPKKLHREVEQKRRLRMAEQIVQLRHWVCNPSSTKTDKVSVLQDAVQYVKDATRDNRQLQGMVTRLQAENAQLRSIISATHPNSLPTQQAQQSPSDQNQMPLLPHWCHPPVTNTGMMGVHATPHGIATSTSGVGAPAGVSPGSSYRDTRMIPTGGGGGTPGVNELGMLQTTTGTGTVRMRSASPVGTGQSMAWEASNTAISRTLSSPLGMHSRGIQRPAQRSRMEARAESRDFVGGIRSGASFAQGTQERLQHLRRTRPQHHNPEEDDAKVEPFGYVKSENLTRGDGGDK